MKTIHQDPVCLGLVMMMMMTILKLFAVHSKTRYKHNAAKLLSELDFWECELHIFNFSAPLPSSPLFLSVCLFEKSPLRHLVYLQVKGDNMKYDILIAVWHLTNQSSSSPSTSGGANVGWRLVDRPTQLICISDIYLLSWRWWPLWSGGTLYQWSVRPKKAS